MNGNNKGMTMIEVLMGFTILILFLAGMSGIIAFSNNIVMRSVDLRKDMEVMQGEMYKLSPIREDISNTVSMIDPDGNKVVNLNKAKVFRFNSDKLKESGISISDEGLGITYYSVELSE